MKKNLKENLFVSLPFLVDSKLVGKFRRAVVVRNTIAIR